MSAIGKRWSSAIESSAHPAYLAIADAIAEDVQTGRLMPAARLPPLRTLARELDLNYTTVARGYAEAQRRKLIDSRPGQGTYIRSISGGAPKTRAVGFAGLIEMTMNLPPETQDVKLLRRMRDGFAHLHESVDINAMLRYQEFGGEACDREAGVRWLARRLPALSTERLLICPGVQNALMGLFSMLVRPGELLCCESLTYPGVKAIATQLGIRVLGLPIDQEGIDPHSFERACRDYAPQALYCNPTFLNPTTATMSAARREAIARVANAFAIPIIEDDAYGLLPNRSVTPLAAYAPDLTFYVTGLAKHVGAGLRVAYLIAPDVRQAKRVTSTLRALTIMASPITTALATCWINNGTAEAALHAIRNESQARQKLAAELLPRGSYQSRPEAFHLWLNLPPHWSCIEFTTTLRARGVGVVGSDAFAVSETPPQAVRVCLGGAVDRAASRHALELIADALNEQPALASQVM